MARAWKLAFAGLAVGSVLAPSGAEAQTLTQPIQAVSAAEVGQSRAARVHNALRTGTEYYRRGEYETAATYFQRAQTGQEDLNADERQSLSQWLQLNDMALKVRREAADQLRQLEDAMSKGRMQEALNGLKTVTSNQQFLAASDKQKLQQITEQLAPNRMGASPPAGSGNNSVLATARSKLTQARLWMSRGNLDAAQALALEADRLNAPYTMGEDTPRSVMSDIAQARADATMPKDAKSLVAASRASLQRGNLDEAEAYAHKAEQAPRSTLSNLKFWDDTPAKVLKDIQTARVRQLARQNAARNGQAPAMTVSSMKPASKDDPASAATTAANTETARKMLKDARAALRAGDVVLAKDLCEKVRALKPELNWWEDTPDKIMVEVRQAEGARDPSQSKSSFTVDNSSADPRMLLKQARDLYNAGKYDEADRAAQQANNGKARWGLFEDSPEKLISEIRKARSKSDQDDSLRLMTEARAAFAKGDLPDAERLAHAADRKHGPYSVWDLGDRPSKLLAEIESAKERRTGSAMPPTPPVVMTTNDLQTRPLPMTSAPEATQVSHTTTTPYMQQPTGIAGEPMAHTTTTPYMQQPVMQQPVMQQPVMQQPVMQQPVMQQPVMQQPVGVVSDGKKAQAQLLLSQARQYQKEGRLVEARQKALEASHVGAGFGPEEDRPEKCLLEAGALCQRRIEAHLQQASECLATAELDNSRYQRAESELTQARQLAVSFGFDTQMIDNKMNVVQQAHNKNWTPSTGAARPPISQASHQMLTGNEAPQQVGSNLLNQARMELRAGQSISARKLAESAFDPRYGVQEEAVQVLRSIDAEEFNQKVLVANRAFDDGMAAFSRRQYPQASAMMRSLEYHLLSPEKQARLKELMLVPEMQPAGAVVQASHTTPGTGTGSLPSMARATDQTGAARSEPDFAKEVEAMQQVKFQQLRTAGLDAMREANHLFQAGDTDHALEVLQDYKSGLANSGVDADRIAMLRRPIDSRLASLNMLKKSRDIEKQQVDKHDSADKNIKRRILADQEKKEQVAALMKQYRGLYKEGKYEEALVLVTKARDLDPDNTAVDAAIYVTRMKINENKAQGLKNEKSEMTLGGLDSTDHEGPYVGDIENPLAINRERMANANARKPLEILKLHNVRSEKEHAIHRRLDQPISSMDFKDTPLKQILDDLQGLTGINIVTDTPALSDAGVSLDTQITMRLDGIALKSALNLLLHQVHLTYVVQNEVLNITTEENARGKLESRIHPVLDLVTPIPNSDSGNMPSALKTAMAGGEAALKLAGPGPSQSLNSLPGGMSQNNVSGNGSITTNTKDNRSSGLEDTLMHLITSTVAPQTWAQMGGHGTIEFYPLGSALIINQTPDIQEQIAELLQALRRLQDQEVAIEIRFITIAESFFERIGVDFNVNIRTDNTKYQPQIVSQQFQPFGFINHFSPSRFLSGMTPGGSLTQDLNIPIKNSSFGMAIPPFGEYPNIPGGNGGLSLGLAFLSDIEVTMFLEAAQGDQRTNVMEAPKLTLFNGQTSTINVTDQQFFVTSVQVLQAGGQIVFVPSNNLFPTGGIQLSMNAVISADRRFVRLSLAPTLSSLASANVPLFPITTFITPIFEGGAVGQPVPFTQFIQQPTFNTISVNTTVNVPDGGTVLMGGMKRLNEGRNEFGPPILSKIPYLNRLFKNTGYGREAESLMIMVTPRIIINEEEEQKAVPGLGSSTPAAEQPR